MLQMRTTTHARPQSYPHGPWPAAPSSGRGPLRLPTPWAARNRARAAQPGDDDRGFRWSDRLRPSPQLLYHMLLAPARLPTASIRSQERHRPRLHHQPRPPPPASRLAPPATPNRSKCREFDSEYQKVKVIFTLARTGDSLHGGRRGGGIRAAGRARARVAEQVLALPSTKVEKEVAGGRGGG